MTHVAVITPTRERKPLLPIIERWVRRQTVPVTWIVVEDSAEPSDHISPDRYLHRLHPSPPDFNTIAGNIFAAVDLVPWEATHVAFMEDDDWYHQGYLESMVGGASTCLNPTVQYDATGMRVRVVTRNRPDGRDRGPLCVTTIPAQQITTLRLAAARCSTSKRKSLKVDIELWSRLLAVSDGMVKPQFAGSPIHVSFKNFHQSTGLLGGFTPYHGAKVPWDRDDPDLEWLRSVLRDDLDAYAQLIPGLRETSTS